MSKKLRIKFLSKNSIEPEHLTRLPNRHPEMVFVLDPAARDYDWLVVHDDLPGNRGERSPINSEALACPSRNTMLLTYEPSSIKFYGDDYVGQFAHVLTSHGRETLSHAGRRDAPPVGIWYYGAVEDVLGRAAPPDKDRQVCIFVSAKRMGHTLHARRFAFQRALTRLLPELDTYGKDIRYVPKKAECIDRYRYTVAVENHVGPHHWTEKLSDSFLGCCLPFYFGCPNAADYFPEESFIPIDIRDPSSVADTIRGAIAADEYEKRLPAIIEARRRVIEEYNLANVIGDVISEASREGGGATSSGHRTRVRTVHSRRSLIRQGPATFLRYAFGKFRARRRTSGQGAW